MKDVNYFCCLGLWFFPTQKRSYIVVVEPSESGSKNGKYSDMLLNFVIHRLSFTITLSKIGNKVFGEVEMFHIK